MTGASLLDLHCRILPGVDDGPKTLDEALEMARFCVADGITHITATPHCHRYVHLLREVTEATARKQCQLAVLVPPATMSHVGEIAGNLEKMPPKSTYFYPKLLSGLVFNPLKGS